MFGVVTTTSSVVGEGIDTAFTVSISGIQIVYGKTFVRFALTSIPTSKTPYIRPGLMTVRPSISSS